jgi:hypothetical protein
LVIDTTEPLTLHAPEVPPQIYTLRELATAIGVTPDSLRQRIARRTLHAFKLGPNWFVTRDEYMRAVAARRRHGQ